MDIIELLLFLAVFFGAVALMMIAVTRSCRKDYILHVQPYIRQSQVQFYSTVYILLKWLLYACVVIVYYQLDIEKHLLLWDLRWVKNTGTLAMATPLYMILPAKLILATAIGGHRRTSILTVEIVPIIVIYIFNFIVDLLCTPWDFHFG